jgi:tetratricopeptide (TPR) repeat protein
LPAFAEALLETGRTEEAAEAATQAVEQTRGRAPLYLAEALRVQGIVLRRQGRAAESERALSEGLELARSLPFPYMEARILEQLGKGEEAVAIFRRLGANKDAERLEQALARQAVD